MNPSLLLKTAVAGLLFSASLAVAQDKSPATGANEQNAGLESSHSMLFLTNAPPALNEINVAYRMGYRLTARFRHLGGLGPLSNPGPATGTYKDHQYDDGFVVRDSRNPKIDTYTWNWGFNSPSQVTMAPDGSYKSVSLHSLSSPATATASAEDDPEDGFEIKYAHCFGHLSRWEFTRNWRWGLEGEFNFTTLSIHDNSTLSYAQTRVTDTYALDGLDPFMPNGAPYHGSVGGGYAGGGGPLINDSPMSRTVQTLPTGATITGQRTLDASVYGWQFGPYLEVPMGKHFAVGLSAGLAIVLVDGEFTCRNETVTMIGMPGIQVGPRTTSSSGTDVLAGYYGGGRISYNFDRSWGVYAGAQYQDVGLYKRHANSNKEAELDLGGNVFVSLGISFSF